MKRRRKLQTALLWGAVAWVALASAFVATRTSIGMSVDSYSSSAGTTSITQTVSRRIDGLLIPLGIPLVIGTLAALAGHYRLRVTVTILIALFCLWNFAAMFSIGRIFLPATGAFIAALTWMFAEP